MPNLGDDASAIHDAGHRRFIGGRNKFWDEISDLQFAFLKSQGLKPEDVFADIACGALRAGVPLIAYLDVGHYIGIEKHIELVIYGVADELGSKTFREKRPQFVISDSFEFGKMTAKPTVAIAQSLFTHLTPADIALCLKNFHPASADNCRLFASFHEAGETGEATQNPEDSHSLKQFYYSPAEMERFGREAGWIARYVGDWGHPRKQRMMEYRKA